eukprot:CAMPEP_0198303900 /NCGR_PEP_ID=MMETSP1449-20131203/57117_1 /TAXON_ID=420275 /ORGANISM="Attheya septentrionalis, Strain CCMP2084" /LENGTH=664 /DNA_ID=CAMNT_0044006407 /DNA_START=317 /DNA_END=2311 /DNA_ORIENTATION=+
MAEGQTIEIRLGDVCSVSFEDGSDMLLDLYPNSNGDYFTTTPCNMNSGIDSNCVLERADYNECFDYSLSLKGPPICPTLPISNDSFCPSVQAPVTCNGGACNYTNPCEAGRFGFDANDCVAIENSGEVCPFVVTCGLNNCTYTNECEAGNVGFNAEDCVRIEDPGEDVCPFVNPLDGNDQCNTPGLACDYDQECCCGECFPSLKCVCGDSLTFNCFFTEACLNADCSGTGDPEDACPSIPDDPSAVCPAVQAPVTCGPNNCTYTNECEAGNVGFNAEDCVRIEDPGEDVCPFVNPLDGNDQCNTPGLACDYDQECCCGECFPSLKCVCGDSLTFNCFFTEACLNADCSGNTEPACPSIADDPSVVCPALQAPVTCGPTNCTYTNDCEAGKVGFNAEDCVRDEVMPSDICGDDMVSFGENVNGVDCVFCAQPENCEVSCVGSSVCICGGTEDDLSECCDQSPCCDNCPEENKPKSCFVSSCGSSPPECSVTICPIPEPACPSIPVDPEEVCIALEDPVTCGPNNCTYSNICVAGTFGFDANECVRIEEVCPSDEPINGECNTPGLKCDYGEEFCCGERHTSLKCECGNDLTFMCFYTEACLSPDCPDIIDDACPSTPDPSVVCNELYEPVTCGTANCPYSNGCKAEAFGWDRDEDCTIVQLVVSL